MAEEDYRPRTDGFHSALGTKDCSNLILVISYHNLKESLLNRDIECFLSCE